MPRQTIGDRPMTDAERQARYRAARAAGKPVVRTRRPADHRSRAPPVAGHRRHTRRAASPVCRLAGRAGGQPPRQCHRPGVAGDLRSRPDRAAGHRTAARVRPGLTRHCNPTSRHRLHRWVHRNPRAPLRLPPEGHSAARGSPLWTTGTSSFRWVSFQRRSRVNFQCRLTTRHCIADQRRGEAL